MVRGQALSAKQLLYIESARALGMSDARIIIRHLLPNIMGPIIVQASFNVAGSILSEASLSFLGLGAQPPTTSWGMMVSEGRYYLRVAPYLILFPGFSIFAVALAFNILGEALRDALDPRSTYLQST
jgi:ABC-type dipeptide/oligopeptide/nickel transport system permease subunit